MSQAWRHFDDSSFSQGQTSVGGPQAAVLALPSHLCSPSHSQALCFCPSTQTFSLGCSEEVVKEAGRAALRDPGRSEVRRHRGIPTNLPGTRECLPTQCGQGSCRTLHCSLPASEAQDCDSESHSYGGPSAPGISTRSSSGADREAPGMTLQVPNNLEKGGRLGGSFYGLAPPRYPQPFLQQTFAFSVRWSDNSNTFVRRSWDEFRRLHVSDPGVTQLDPPLTPTGVPALTPWRASCPYNLGKGTPPSQVNSSGRWDLLVLGPIDWLVLALRRPSRRPSQ